MNSRTLLFIVVAVVVGYLLGVKYPATGQQILSKASMAA